MKETLFSRLASYSFNSNKLSIENFTTEVLAYLFNEDRAFRRRFLGLIMPDGRALRAFAKGQAETQVRFPKCIADIVIESARGKRHFVEVKVDAHEAMEEDGGRLRSQIDRYLDLKMGNVTFLTTRHTPPHQAELRGRRFSVNHVHFESLYTLLHGVTLSETGKQLVRFMKEKQMSPAEPLTKRDLRTADSSVEVYKRCLELMIQLRQEVSDTFVKNMSPRAHLRAPVLDYGPDWSFFDCYLRHFRKKGPIRTAGFGLSIQPDGIYLSVYVWGTRTQDLRDFGEKVLGWEDMNDGKGFEKYMKLRGGRAEFSRMKQFILKNSHRLGRAVARHF